MPRKTKSSVGGSLVGAQGLGNVERTMRTSGKSSRQCVAVVHLDAECWRCADTTMILLLAVILSAMLLAVVLKLFCSFYTAGKKKIPCQQIIISIVSFVSIVSPVYSRHSNDDTMHPHPCQPGELQYCSQNTKLHDSSSLNVPRFAKYIYTNYLRTPASE